MVGGGQEGSYDGGGEEEGVRDLSLYVNRCI